MICPKCSSTITEAKNFCPECGASLARSNFGFKSIFLLILIATVLWGFSWYTKNTLAGARPLRAAPEEIPTETTIDDSALASLKSELESDPKNIEKLRTLGQALSERLLNSKQPSNSLVFELISVLDRILEIAPNDEQALLNRANIAYNFHSYEKAEEYFKRYLSIRPDDITSRTAFASTLTLLGNFDAAEKELSHILKDDPKNFPALANRYVNLIAKGDTAKAQDVAKIALNAAPSDEARAKLEELIENFSKDKDDKQADTPHSTSPERGTLPAAPLAALEGYLKAHPITGPKFVGLEQTAEGTLKIKFHDFPMQNMPPFPKSKFLDMVKDQIKAIPENQRPKKVEFIDVGSNSVMETL